MFLMNYLGIPSNYRQMRLRVKNNFIFLPFRYNILNSEYNYGI